MDIHLKIGDKVVQKGDYSTNGRDSAFKALLNQSATVTYISSSGVTAKLLFDEPGAQQVNEMLSHEKEGFHFPIDNMCKE